jgi:hypothetical protein
MNLCEKSGRGIYSGSPAKFLPLHKSLLRLQSTSSIKKAIMKNIVTIAICCLLGATTFAQKVVEKRLSFSGKEAVKLDLHISDSIGISTWNKNEVYVKATININNNQDNELYKVSFDESGNALSVNAKFESDKKRTWNNDCCNYNSEILWEVFIPENARFSVETINGNITIVGKTDEIRASTISGFIDLAVPGERKADFRLSTVTGTVYSDIISSQDAAKSKRSNSNISNQYNGGGKPVNLKTISGDIYLRKAG